MKRLQWKAPGPVSPWCFQVRTPGANLTRYGKPDALGFWCREQGWGWRWPVVGWQESQVSWKLPPFDCLLCASWLWSQLFPLFNRLLVTFPLSLPHYNPTFIHFSSVCPETATSSSASASPPPNPHSLESLCGPVCSQEDEDIPGQSISRAPLSCLGHSRKKPCLHTCGQQSLKAGATVEEGRALSQQQFRGRKILSCSAMMGSLLAFPELVPVSICLTPNSQAPA
jgi:hypothetical protein